ncbi:MAG: Hsp20/alpha crystallin family protein [Spirochaetota bacterium]
MNTKTEDKRTVYITPATDILEEESKYVLRSDIPGVDRDNLSVSVENNMLEIEGRTSRELFDINANDESPEYAYRRTFRLNQEIDSSSISAHLENGVLTLELGKSEALKPRKIEVTAVS